MFCFSLLLQHWKVELSVCMIIWRTELRRKLSHKGAFVPTSKHTHDLQH
jgi:hypothetical protein